MKINWKNTPFCVQISRKGWIVNCYAVEVGARGFCAESMRFCLRSLGFKNKEVKSRFLSQIAVRSSFTIWLSRVSKVWDKDFIEGPPNMAHTVITTSVPRKNSSSSAATVTPSTIPVPSEREKAESNMLPNLSGLVNKGNTCYANAILQSLNAFSKFSHVLSSISNGNNKLNNSLLKILYKLRTSKTFVDPSAFLK